MKYSVAIVVRNDREIGYTLADLTKVLKKHRNFEVVVVDASTLEALEDIKEEFPAVRWFYFENTSGKRFTIPEQRNMAIDKASGDVVVFIDAGCRIMPDWAEALIRAFDDPSINMVAGMVVSDGETKSTYDHGYESRTDGGELDECGAANLAARKTVLQAIGGFDTSLSYGEDVDLTWRAVDAGYKIIFKKGMVIAHNWGDFEDEMRRTFRYGQSRIALYKKHPQRWRNLLGIDMIVVIYPLYLVLLPLTLWLWWYPLLIVVPMLRNLGKQPFRTTFLHLIYGAGVIKGIFKSV